MRATVILCLLLSALPVRRGAEIVRPEVVGGTADGADPAVVAVTFLMWPTCSGTLIGPRTVLTAGHCIFHLPFISPSIAFGPHAWKPERRIKVVQQRAHPRYTAEGAAFDVGLLQLETAVTDILPVQLSGRVLSSSDVGASIRHVGYGASSDMYPVGLGTKRSVRYPITQVSDTRVWSGGHGKQTCLGDSGGPGLMREGPFSPEQIVSVISDGPNCHEIGWDSRVDLAAAWIAETQAGWDVTAVAKGLGR